METKIGVLGLGYVGLPLALAFARVFNDVVGFDINERKVDSIRRGVDPTDEGLDGQLANTKLKATTKIEDLAHCNFFVVGVPTPVDENRTPDLFPLRKASELVAKIVKKGDVIVFESTVYPGVTEEICGPIIESVSGLVCGKDFFLGYSPERINPGDREHTLERITKVVSGQNADTLERVASVYGSIIEAGIFRAPSIKVAEAAKVIENTQRDLNIALMNELSIIFDRLGIATRDVLAAASTKWNFLRFTPGLVGGHCIGVDPYYLTTKAQQLGYHPQVILAGRRINDDMGKFVAQKLVKLLIEKGIQPKGAKVGILGVTFKENVADVRNSRVPDIYYELDEFGINCLVYDPHGDADEAKAEYGVTLSPISDLTSLDAVVIAVSHREIVEMTKDKLFSMMRPDGVIIDVKSIMTREQIPAGISYWSL